MGLLKRLFKSDRGGAETGPPSATRFDASDDQDDEAAEREAGRRDLVRLTLRETMGRHAVPSNWIECRMLPAVTSKRKSGLHVQLVVNQGQASLLTYIPAFQSSLMAEIERFDPRAAEWLLSISWQFAGITSRSAGPIPEDSDRGMAGFASGAAALNVSKGGAGAEDAEDDEDDVAADLEALFAIRYAALQAPGAQQHDFEDTRPGFAASEGGAATEPAPRQR